MAYFNVYCQWLTVGYVARNFDYPVRLRFSITTCAWHLSISSSPSSSSSSYRIPVRAPTKKNHKFFQSRKSFVASKKTVFSLTTSIPPMKKRCGWNCIANLMQSGLGVNYRGQFIFRTSRYNNKSVGFDIFKAAHKKCQSFGYVC